MKISSVLGLAILGLLNLAAQADDAVLVCARTLQVRQGIEITFKRPCKDISIADLDELDGLDLKNSNLVTLQESDFVGLNHLTILLLGGNPQLRFDPKILKTLKMLQTLDLSQSGRKSFKPGFFDSLSSLIQLDIGGPELDYIPDNEFVMLPNIQTVDVAGSPLRNTSKGAFRGVENVNGLPDTFGVDPGFDNSKWP